MNISIPGTPGVFAGILLLGSLWQIAKIFKLSHCNSALAEPMRSGGFAASVLFGESRKMFDN